jgi:hypothetical protein
VGWVEKRPLMILKKPIVFHSFLRFVELISVTIYYINEA